MTGPPVQPGSSSLQQPDYWWYRARAALLEAVLGPFLGAPRRLLDVGSADGPSVGWMSGPHLRVNLDIVLEGLVPGAAVCGSATALPFAEETFDVVGAFDVVERRVLARRDLPFGSSVFVAAVKPAGPGTPPSPDGRPGGPLGG